MVDLQFPSATSNGTRRYQDDLVTMLLTQPCYLVNQCRHTGDVQSAVRACEGIRAYFNNDSFTHLEKVVLCCPCCRLFLLLVVFLANLYSANLAADSLR